MDRVLESDGKSEERRGERDLGGSNSHKHGINRLLLKTKRPLIARVSFPVLSRFCLSMIGAK